MMTKRDRVVRFIVLMVAITTLSWPAAANAQTFKQLPPAGIKIDSQVRADLQQRVDALGVELQKAVATSTDADAWRPDIEVLVRAVRLALEQNLFFRKSEPKAAAKLLDEAERRLTAAASGARGLVLLGLEENASDKPQLLVGGFQSRIDDSIQPYGLVVPASYSSDKSSEQSLWRVDVWLHGRGDTKMEVLFLDRRMTKVGQYAPADTFVLHPFGRHCNAFKFAGETDVFESLDHLKQLIPVNEDRIAIRGFSMGGAGCWHLAVHHPTRWFAANPGAGFVDTIVYQGWDQKPPFEIDETRRKLLQLYDILPWVRNLKNTNMVAYSGEVDKQRQAADRIVKAASDLDIPLTYVVGEKMGHKINPESAEKVESAIDAWSSSDTAKSPRPSIDFTTYTLRHSRADWLSITGMIEHWTPSNVRGTLVGSDQIFITTRGVTHLKLDFRQSGWPGKPGGVSLMIDGHRLQIDDTKDAPGLQCELALDGDWSVSKESDAGLRKRPGLQGPIDDAFYERFVFVVPSRPAKHGVVQRWIDRELAYAKDRWKRLMRGDVRIVQDTEVTEEHIKTCHLVCFGDLSSNQYLRSVASQLPVQWTRDELKVGSQTFNPNVHAAVFCFPNPKNPQRYIVVNSGMTFREFSNVSNSRQIAMLPDWAIMDVRDQSNDAVFAGKIVAEGFFDEQWLVKSEQ